MSFEHEIERLLAKIESFADIPNKHDLHQLEHKIMTAIENLNDAITKLQASVDAAVTDINTPHPTETAVQAAADAVTAQSARLDAAVNPPVTPPTTPAA